MIIQYEDKHKLDFTMVDLISNESKQNGAKSRAIVKDDLIKEIVT